MFTFLPLIFCTMIWKQSRYPAPAMCQFAQYLCLEKNTIFLKLWSFWSMLEGSDSVAIAKPPISHTNGSQVPAPHSIWNLLLTSVTSCKSPMAINREESSMQIPVFPGAALASIEVMNFFSPSPDLLRIRMPVCLLERAPSLELWIVFKDCCWKFSSLHYNFLEPDSPLFPGGWLLAVNCNLSGTVLRVFCLKVS